MAAIQKMATPMSVKTAGARFHGCSDPKQPYARSLSSSSSNSVVHMLPALNPTSRYLATKHANKLPSSDCQLHLLASVAHRAVPINALMQSSAPSAPPNSTNHDCKAPLILSEHWREIQGQKHWDGLLDHPINETLRAEIIRYGEFAQVCYDAFDFSQHSLYCGSCKYNRRALFEKVDKGDCGYEVTKYLYATSKLDLPKFFKRSERKEEPGRWSRDSNWIGYVAVCTDEDEIRRIGRRDILIAWRGTVTTTEWVDDLMLIQAPANIELAVARSRQPLHSQLYNAASSRIQNADVELAIRSCAHDRHLSSEDLNEVVKVETGFLSLYSSIKASSKFNKLSAGQQMAMEVKRLLQKYEGEEISISITGHSLGAALALLCAYDIAANVGASASDIAVPQSYTTAATMPSGIIGAAIARQGKPTIAAGPISLFALLNKAAPPPHKAQLGAANSAASSACRTSYVNEAVPSVLAAATPTSACFNMAAGGSKGAAPPEVRSSTPLITVYSFGGPRVGNRAFKRRLEDLGVRVLRIVNVHDCVPKLPGVLFNERSPQVWPNTSGYHHVGKELSIDFDFSPHLRKTHDLASHHNLEAHLHVLDGFHGFTCPFQSIFKRNPALVNKSSDFLQRGAFIPPYWWQDHNKGLVKDPLSGQWVLASREDDHIPEIHHPELPQAYTS